jgi:hypothetical protein
MLDAVGMSTVQVIVANQPLVITVSVLTDECDLKISAVNIPEIIAIAGEQNKNDYPFKSLSWPIIKL